MSRVITLPRQGILVAATDLHGNLGDFRAVVSRFRALQDDGMDPQLVICGDLVHGPAIPWPRGQSTSERTTKTKARSFSRRLTNCSGLTRGRSTTCSATMSTRIWAGLGLTSSIQTRPPILSTGTARAGSSRSGTGLPVGPG